MFTAQQDLAQGVVLEICERDVTLSRSLENLKRVEGAVGAAAPFAARLDARAATHAEIVRVYQALLAGVIDAPAKRDVEAWAFKKGTRHSELATFVYSLTLGCDELDAVIAVRNMAAGKDGGADDKRPFSPTDGPTGPSSSASATGSGGLRERFGRLRSSS